jgi:hypothetical protein
MTGNRFARCRLQTPGLPHLTFTRPPLPSSPWYLGASRDRSSSRCPISNVPKYVFAQLDVEVEMICYRCCDVDTKPSSVANFSSATYHASKEHTEPSIGFIIQPFKDQQSMYETVAAVLRSNVISPLFVARGQHLGAWDLLHRSKNHHPLQKLLQGTRSGHIGVSCHPLPSTP